MINLSEIKYLFSFFFFLFLESNHWRKVACFSCVIWQHRVECVERTDGRRQNRADIDKKRPRLTVCQCLITNKQRITAIINAILLYLHALRLQSACSVCVGGEDARLKTSVRMTRRGETEESASWASRQTITAMMEGRHEFLCGVVEGKFTKTSFIWVLGWEPQIRPKRYTRFRDTRLYTSNVIQCGNVLSNRYLLKLFTGKNKRQAIKTPILSL